MKFNLDKKTIEFLKIILKNALEQNIRVFFVGGIVRDCLLKSPIKDIDLIIEGNAIDFCENIKDEIVIKSKHLDFATVKVEYKNLEIDIASTRKESYPFSGCLPKVLNVGVPIEQDVLRRDFSVNSLYCELKLINDKIEYHLIDLVGGFEDIKLKQLKVLHNSSYIDDPTRIIRGVNFKNRFNFEFSEMDKKLINSYLSDISYENRSEDRILDVFKMILSSEFKIDNFKEIVSKKYYKILNSTLNIPEFEIIQKNAKFFDLTYDEFDEYFLNILCDKECLKFVFENKLQIYKTFKKFNNSKLAYYYLKTNDENVISYLKIKNIELNINGKTLVNLGYKQGKIYSEIMDELLLFKINNNKILTMEDEIEWVKTNYPI